MLSVCTGSFIVQNPSELVPSSYKSSSAEINATGIKYLIYRLLTVKAKNDLIRDAMKHEFSHGRYNFR